MDTNENVRKEISLYTIRNYEYEGLITRVDFASDSRARAHSRTRKKRRALRGLFVHWTIFRFIDAQVTATERGGTGGRGSSLLPFARNAGAY